MGEKFISGELEISLQFFDIFFLLMVGFKICYRENLLSKNKKIRIFKIWIDILNPNNCKDRSTVTVPIIAHQISIIW